MIKTLEKTLNSNYDKKMKSVNSIKTYAYGTSKDLVSKKRRD